MAKRNGIEASWPASKVELWPIKRIVPYENNPRLHPPEQVDLIARSMLDEGVTAPILVDEAGVIIYGHGRRLAALKNGFAKYPVCVARGWTELKKKSVRLKDNSLSLLSDWSAPLLKTELTELAHLGYDMPLLGFDEYHLVQFMATEPDPEAEVAPEPPVNPVTRRGDLWVCGDHRILCGDATSKSDVAACLAGAKPHLMVTDPPYGVDYDPDWRNRADRANGKPYGDRAVGRVQNDDQADWSAAWALFPGDVVYAWSPPGSRQLETGGALEAAGFEIRQQIIWVKPRHVIGRGNYHYRHEPCWYAVRKGKTAHWSGARDQDTAWEIEHAKSETGHGTQKPIECMKCPILNNSRPGEAVYDPFVGSGTTIIAAEMTKRRALTIEIDPIYCDVAVERWAKLTGKTPILEATGQTFAEVQTARYDGQADAAGSFADGFAAVRERVAQGGPGWAPGAPKAPRKRAPRTAPSAPAKA
jgi:DNA modification methylase